MFSLFFFFTVASTTEFYTLSLHDALPIFGPSNSARGRGSSFWRPSASCWVPCISPARCKAPSTTQTDRSEEHTSELQSRRDLVCRLLLEKKKKTIYQGI